MKAFRGTLRAAVLLFVVVGLAWWIKPQVVETDPVGNPRLFDFEKHELVRVEVVRPQSGVTPARGVVSPRPLVDTEGGTLVLEEKDGRWEIAGTGFAAGRSMVNRVKHQIHDLTARATVVTSPEEPELYGLGDNAIHVTLTMRDGRSEQFLVGDPNPSSVSYYIRPLPGEQIYTVQKAAVDYYSLTLDEFRERRFASFDSKDVTRLVADLRLEGEVRLELERVGDRQWEMHSPIKMAANDERVRRLLGRVSALKARDFEVIPASGKAEMLTERGIEEPLARITVEFASRDPLVLRVGNDAPETSKHQQHAYMWLEDDTTVYVARKGLLDEFGKDPKELRNRRVVRMTAEEVVSIDVVLRATEDDELAGEHGVRFAVEQWVWKDGVPVPGSTPKRVAENLAELEVEAFVDDEPGQLKAYGLDNPIARVVLADREGLERVVLIGGYGEPDIGPDDREIKRRYVSIEGAQSVYLAGERTVDVVRDLIREGNRKQRKDRERAARRERIPTVQAPEEESL